MKPLKLKTSILIASIYAAVFFGVMRLINKVIPSNGISGSAYHAFKAWNAWTPLVLGMIAFVLFGVLVYKTDWKKR